MAVEPTLQILIKATDQASGVLTGVGTHMAAIADGAKTVSQPFADLSTAVFKLDAALTAMVGGGLALAVAESGKFSGAFAEVTTLFDATPAQLDQFRGDILDFAKESVSSFDDINGAVYAAISAGAKYSESLGLVRQAEQTAVAGKASLNDATVLLASSLNAYGAEMSDAASYSDALFVAVRDGQTTLPELSTSLAQVTGLAATSGVSFDELLAAVATLTASGLPTSQAVTAIRGALTGILKPTKDASDAAQGIGLQFDSAALASQGLGGFMQALATKTGGNVDVMSKLFGSIEGLNGALILTGTGAQKFSAALDDMKNKAGATTAAYDKMVGEMDQINQKLANNVKVTLVAVGDKIKDDYAGLVGSLIEVFQSIESAVKAGTFDGLFAVIEGAFNKAETGLKNIAKNLPEALNGVDLTALADAFGGMFDGIDLSSATGLRDAIQLVVDSLESLVTFSRGIVDGLKPFIGLLAEAVDWFNGLDESTKSAIATLTGVMTAVSLLAGPLGAAAQAVSVLGKGLGALTGYGPGLANLASSIAGPAGVATVIGASAVAVGLAVKGYGEWQQAEDDLAASLKRGADATADLNQKYQDISRTTGVVITNHQELQAAVAEGQIHMDAATHSWQAGAGQLRDYKKEVADAAAAELDYNASLKSMVDANGNLKGVVIATTHEIDDQKQSLIDYYISIGNSPKIAKAMAKIETQTGRIPAAVKDAKDKSKVQSDKLITDLASIASDERIKGMELSFKLDQTALQGEIDKAKAIIGTLDTQINSTEKLLGGLFDNLVKTGPGDFVKKWDIEDQISKENDIRKTATDDAHKLNVQLLKINDAKLKQIEKGGGLIKIDGSGLEPALEMIMWEVIKKVQMTASADAQDLLLGI